MNSLQTTWIWQNPGTGGVQGAVVDLDEQVIRWFNEPGCNCDVPEDTQSIADFLAQDTPYVSVPPEIGAELRAMLRASHKQE